MQLLGVQRQYLPAVPVLANYTCDVRRATALQRTCFLSISGSLDYERAVPWP